MDQPLIIRCRRIGDNELECITHVIHEGWDRGRTWISRELCRRWDWRQHNGLLKDQVCRILLNDLARRELIELPPGKRGVRTGHRRYHVPPETPPECSQDPLVGSLEDFPRVHLRMVRRQPEEALWDYLVHQHHYKGYRIVVGSHLKYIAFMDETPVACLAWGSSVFRIQDRDLFLEWDPESRTRGIRYLANNTRFLILPWIRIKNLASHLLALSARAVSQDWQNFYGHPLYVLETFVETERFQGTCYRAANWIRVGSTKGHAKRGGKFYHHGIRKDVYLYPLVPDFRKRLAQAEAVV